MEYYANRLCISHAELTAGILTESNIKLLRHRGKLQQVRRGCYDTPALFAVDSLPLKYRTEVYRRYPDAQDKADSKPFMDTIIPDGEAMAYYESYTLADGRHLTAEMQAMYANNCAIMNAFRQVIETANSHRLRQSKPKLNKTEFWKKAAAALPRLADHFPHSLPESERRLQRKFNEYLQVGYECFISKKFHNKNSAKVYEQEQEDVLVTFLAEGNNLPDTLVAEHYNRIGEVAGWKAITASAVRVWREKMDLTISAGRLGKSNFRNHKTMQVKRSRPTAPMLMWSLDGWTVELLYQDTKSDSKGHNRTTYTNRLTMVVVLDVFNNYPIGYAIGTHESPALIKEALRDAAKHTEELFGEMLRVNQIQSDRYAIKTMHDIYALMGDKVTPAQAHNAKAKPVEPYFKYLNMNYCIRCNNWSGFGITTDPKRQPNAEALNRRRHHFPDEAGLRMQISEMMRLERMGKGEAYVAGMLKLKPEHRLPMSRESYLLNFGSDTGFKNTLEGGGLRPTLLGVKRDYDCFDVRFREHAGTRWTVKYDPDNLSEVLAVNEDGSLRFMLEEKYVQPMALADRKEGDAEQLQRIREFNRGMESHTAERLLQAYETTREIIAGAPALHGGIEDRLLITDSRGQHKDRRSAKRLKAAEVEAIEVNIVSRESCRYIDETDDYGIF
ncbi:MAG: hypothetical protein IJA46_08515 [Bacteroidaceae bacterium]|nr:hypothetical protein [Bacteroidaceae bacterium]